MSGSKLESVNEENNLGIGLIVSDDWSGRNTAMLQIYAISNRILGIITGKQNFTDKSKQVNIPLYKSLVWPHLEYCCQSQIWNPNYNKDIDLVGVQRWTTKLITGMQNLSYDDRVKRLGLIRLSTRAALGACNIQYTGRPFDKQHRIATVNKMLCHLMPRECMVIPRLI